MPCDSLPAGAKGFAWNAGQEDVRSIGSIDAGWTTVCSMPTGAGKTALAWARMQAVVAAGQTAIYVAPLRAIVAEKVAAWSAERPDLQIAGYHGAAVVEEAYADQQIRVMTYERLDGLMRQWRRHPWLVDVGVVVVDEVHLLADPGRGPRLEGTLSRILRLLPFCQVICLSATMSNREELAAWLSGVAVHTTWRPVPLTHTRTTYRSAAHKQETLLHAVAAAASRGTVLVFAASRRRAETMAADLRTAGLAAAHHHAGLTTAARAATEADFRAGRTRVLVATPTLECGVNLPCRTVIIADDSRWTEGGWEPLSAWRYHQMAGRAGRPGQDGSGTACILTARWNPCPPYERLAPEPIMSRLQSGSAMLEQVLIEVTSRMCRTRAHLVEAFVPATLLARQTPQAAAHVGRFVDDLLGAGLLWDDAGTLRPTPVGMVAVRHHLEPATVTTVCGRRHLDHTEMDLLLTVCWLPELTPVLRLHIEQAESLADVLSTTASARLDEAPPAGVPGRRVAAGVLMAHLLRMRARGEDPTPDLERWQVRPADLDLLIEATVRILRGCAACIAVLEAQDDGDSPRPTHLSQAERMSQVAARLEGGCDPDSARLLEIPGLGPARAATLRAAGIGDLEALSLASAEDLLALPGIGPQSASTWPDAAAHLVARETFAVDAPRSHPRVATAACAHWPDDLDAGRLSRASGLRVAGAGPWQVTGGADTHSVDPAFACDCLDARANAGRLRCKHVLAVQLHLGDQVLATCLDATAAPTGASTTVIASLPTLLASRGDAQAPHP